MADKIINLEEKRDLKEYKETGMIKCNLPFTPEDLANGNVGNPAPSLWQKIVRRFIKEEVTPDEEWNNDE